MTSSPATQRTVNMLQKTVGACSYWLMAQGVLMAMMGPGISTFLRLRYHENMRPYLFLGGLSLAMLGLFIHRAVREAQKQYLAVDILLLFFLALTALRLRYRVEGYPLTPFEWASVVVDLGLGSALIAFRTRGSQMTATGSWVSSDMIPFSRQLLAKVQTVIQRLQSGRKPQATGRPAEAVPPADPLPQLGTAPNTDTVATETSIPQNVEALSGEVVDPPAPAKVSPPPKPISTAIPHMD